jgi:hypothetical protein
VPQGNLPTVVGKYLPPKFVWGKRPCSRHFSNIYLGRGENSPLELGSAQPYKYSIYVHHAHQSLARHLLIDFSLSLRHQSLCASRVRMAGDSDNLQPWAIATTISLTVLAVVSVCLRVLSRFERKQKLWWDDWMIIWSMVRITRHNNGGWFLTSLLMFCLEKYRHGISLSLDSYLG